MHGYNLSEILTEAFTSFQRSQAPSGVRARDEPVSDLGHFCTVMQAHHLTRLLRSMIMTRLLRSYRTAFCADFGGAAQEARTSVNSNPQLYRLANHGPQFHIETYLIPIPQLRVGPLDDECVRQGTKERLRSLKADMYTRRVYPHRD